MGKFVIECPHCGRMNQASNFIFAKKKIPCACGSVIDIKTEKLTSKTCQKCGNAVVFDQTKGEKASCPVCRELINTNAGKVNLTEFVCPQCTCNISVDKSASSYTCPICDSVIDVQKEIAKAKMVSDGKISVIKYEGDNKTFVWKHPIEDFNMGSQLIVHESQEALFFRDGQALDLFPSGRFTLETQKLPIIGKLYQLPVEPMGVFHSEVYFINLTTQMGIRWGTDSRVRFIEPKTQMPFDIGACGEFNLRVADSRRLVLKLVGTTDKLQQSQLLSSGNSLQGFFRALLLTKVKAFLAKTIKEQDINILEIDEHLEELSEALRVRLDETMTEYGLTIPEFYVTTISTPDDDPNFRRMKQQHADRYLKVTEEKNRLAEAEAARSRKVLEAQTDAQLKIIGAQGDSESYRLKAEAEAREMQMKGYTYQQETARQVGLAAVENGFGGGGGGGGSGGMTGGLTGMVGDMMNLGIGLGAVSSVVGMTKEAMQPMTGLATDMKGAVSEISANKPNGWDCTSCGFKGNTTNFCGNCGAKKPSNSSWDCACGFKGNSTNFCGNCGAKKPSDSSWDCACGFKGNTTNFCGNCGTKKPSDNSSWDCACGFKGNSTNFCGNCGKKRDEK